MFREGDGSHDTVQLFRSEHGVMVGVDVVDAVPGGHPPGQVGPAFGQSHDLAVGYSGIASQVGHLSHEPTSDKTQTDHATGALFWIKRLHDNDVPSLRMISLGNYFGLSSPRSWASTMS